MVRQPPCWRGVKSWFFGRNAEAQTPWRKNRYGKKKLNVLILHPQSVNWNEVQGKRFPYRQKTTPPPSLIPKETYMVKKNPKKSNTKCYVCWVFQRLNLRVVRAVRTALHVDDSRDEEEQEDHGKQHGGLMVDGQQGVGMDRILSLSAPVPLQTERRDMFSSVIGDWKVCFFTIKDVWQRSNAVDKKCFQQMDEEDLKSFQCTLYCVGLMKPIMLSFF